jgi:hypothetical protein
MILIFHADGRLASDALADVIGSAFAFHDDNIEFGRESLRR